MQADLKTFAAHGVYGTSAITAVTAQNTQAVLGVHPVPAAFVADQISAVFDDFDVAAVKIGMLATPEVVEAVAARLRHYSPRHIVFDPVLVATSGDSLGAEGVVDAMRQHLLPLANLITPNLAEAAALTGGSELEGTESMVLAARALIEGGAKAVLVTGGDLDGEHSSDLLDTGSGPVWLETPRVATQNTHGTGCTLSSAIAARLALGDELEAAVRHAKAYVTDCLKAADSLGVGGGGIGEGHGPLHHFHRFDQL